MTDIYTAHEGFDGIEFVRHTDPACGFIAFGTPFPAALPTASDCRFCIGGDDVKSLGRVPRTVTTILDTPATETEANEGNYKQPSNPNPTADAKPYEQRLADVKAWLVALGRKTEISDVTHANKRVAQEWTQRYTGDFAFILDLKAKGGVKSDGQAKGVLNTIRAEALRENKPAEPKTGTAPTVERAGVDLRGLHAGRYAYQPEDGQAQFYKVDVPDTSDRWGGWVFVKAVYGGDRYDKVTAQRPGADTAKPSQRDKALEAIVADPKAAMLLYGRLIGECGHCGRTLTNERSRELGIGPVCAKRMTWLDLY